MMNSKKPIDIKAFKQNANEMMAAYLTGCITVEEKDVFEVLLKTDSEFMKDWLVFLGHFSIHDVLTDFKRWMDGFLSAEEIMARYPQKE